MMIFKSFFHSRKQPVPMPLCVEGVKTVMTPVPDEAETAAQALLESLSQNHGGHRDDKPELRQDGDTPENSHVNRDAEYYRHLAAHIRNRHEEDARQTLRYVAYCEQELNNRHLPVDLVFDIGRELALRLDVVEREGGELKRRWQHCLADVTLRQASGQYIIPSSQGNNI